MPTWSALARIQQCVVAGLLAAAAAWLAWRWPQSHNSAIAGALAILFLHVWVLGIEFIVLRFVALADPAPLPTPWQLLRAWLGESVMAVRVFGWRQPFRWNAIDDHVAPECKGRRGVVFIHGFVCNRGLWTPWMQELQRLDRAFVAVNLEPVFSSIDQYAPTIADAVARVRAATGLAPVLVCHSMGGLAARAWMRSSLAADAHRIVTIGTPHHGTWIARHSRTPSGLQMRRTSAWLRNLEAGEVHRGYAAFTCWYSNCDNIVMPPSTAILEGADNRFVPGIAHVELAFDERVVKGTLALID